MDRAQWLAERKHGLGSSDAAAVCRVSPWRTPLHVYLEKTGELPDQDTEQKKWGRRLEDLVAEAYSEETGNPVYKPARPIEKHRTLPWMLASLDRLTEVGGRGRILEIKTASYETDEWGAPGTDEVPPHYLVQCQHQMAVTGIKTCDLAVLFSGNKLRTYTIEKNDRFIAGLEKVLSDFWALVQKREPPAIDWNHPSTPDLILGTQRVDDEKEIELGDDSLPVIQDYLHAKSLAKQWGDRAVLCKAQLIAMLGDARLAVSPEGHRVRRTRVHRKAYMVDEMEYFMLSIKEPKDALLKSL